MRYKLIIKSVTPIHIGSGKNYPLFSIIDNFRYSEEEIIRKFIDEKLKSLGEISLEIIAKIGEKMTEEIPQYAVKVKDELTPLYKVSEVDRSILSENKMRNIEETMKYVEKDISKPFIPASTIKGVFLTVWLYNNIQNKDGKNINQILGSEIEKEGNKKITLLNLLERPQMIEKYIEKLKGLFNDEFPKITVSDCLFSFYKLKVGKLYVGRRPPIIIETVDEFEGNCVFDVEGYNALKLISYLKNFNLKYMEKLENLKKDIGNIRKEVIKMKEELLTMKENESYIVLGKFTNLYSKSMQLLLNGQIPGKKGIRLPTILRYFEINGKRMPIGFAKIELLEE